MKDLNNEIEINASADRVWQLLTDFASFPQWNPFIQQVSGELKRGAQLVVHIQPSGAHATTIRPTVLKAEPNRELRWMKRWLMPGLLDAEHSFTILPLDANRVRFTQREIFTGLFSSFSAYRRNTDTRRGFREMAKALKLRAEQPHSAE
jgi:hypothetical protein